MLFQSLRGRASLPLTPGHTRGPGHVTARGCLRPDIPDVASAEECHCPLAQLTYLQPFETSGTCGLQTLQTRQAARSPCSLAMLKPAFIVMGRATGRSTSCRGGRSRLLGRCFTVSAQNGNAAVVTLALQCRADLEQRINGQSALDSAAQAGHLDIAETLLRARAVATQTARGRWTPLMRAAQDTSLL